MGVHFDEKSVRYPNEALINSPERDETRKSPRYKAQETRKSPHYEKSPKRPSPEEKSPKRSSAAPRSPSPEEKSPKRSSAAHRSPIHESKGTSKKSADKVLFQAFKTKTCKEIREELTATTMTEEEQIAFITQHYSSSRGLQSYIKKQHYSAQELKFMAQAGSDFCTIIQHKAYDLYNGMIDPSDANDADCMFLNDKMKTYYANKESSADSKWAKILKISKQVLSSTYEFGKSAAGYITYGLSWAASKGFQLWTWISTNPKTAYFSLMMLKTFKTQLCRMGGQYWATAGVIMDDKESILAFIKKTYPDIEPPPPNSKLDDALRICRDASVPIVTDIIGKSAGKLLGKAAENMGPLVGKTLGAAFKGIPFVGPLVGGAIEAITETVFKEAADSAAFLAEQTTYQVQVNNCFSMLKDLVNPFTCLEEMAKEAYKIVKPLAPVKAEPGLIKAAAEAAKPEKEEPKKGGRSKKGIFGRRARPSVKRRR